MVGFKDTSAAQYEDARYAIKSLDAVLKKNLHRAAKHQSPWKTHLSFYISATNLEMNLAFGTIAGITPAVGRRDRATCEDLLEFLYNTFSNKMHHGSRSMTLDAFCQRYGIKTDKLDKTWELYFLTGVHPTPPTPMPC